MSTLHFTRAKLRTGQGASAEFGTGSVVTAPLAPLRRPASGHRPSPVGPTVPVPPVPGQPLSRRPPPGRGLPDRGLRASAWR